MSDENLLQELAALRAANRALDEQVKLLVQTEQRLYRAQTKSDRQLARIRALNDLALRCSSVSTERLILKCTIEMLARLFDHDLCVAIRMDSDEGQAHYSRWNVLGDEEVGSSPYSEPGVGPLTVWLEGIERATLIEVNDDERLDELRPLIDCLDQLTHEPVIYQGSVLLLLPLRPTPDQLLGAIVLRRLRRPKSTFFLDPPTVDALPFLQLVGNHVDRALHEVQVADALRRRSVTLAERNRALQQSVTQAAKMELIGQLAGGIAHDFNNLLTVILGSSQVLGRRLRDLGLGASELDDVIGAAERAATLTRQLLVFSRQQQRRLELLDLNELVVGMSKMLSRLLGERVQIEQSLDPAAKPIRADRGQLEQILLNLVVNARDAMPDGGTISILTEATRRTFGENDADCVALSVIDQGSGMDDETRARVFEPFFTTKQPGKGTGMGLATVYGIVAQNGGEIALTSAPGEGARFDVYLPVSSVQPLLFEPGVKSSEVLLVPSSGGKTVLLVEDEEAVRRLGERILTERGYSVITAASGEEALLTSCGDRVDLLLTDVVMPGVSGVELATRLRQSNPSLSVVYMSGYASDMLDEHGIDEEKEHYLPKPFTEDTLLASVSKALR
jgi:signal transduction histidine kinase/CheY-like chemotaxis protein